MIMVGCETSLMSANRDGSQGVHSACDPGEQTQETTPDIDIRTLGEDKKRKVNKAPVHPGDKRAKPCARDTANDGTDRNERDHKFEIVRGNGDISVAQRFEQPDLLALQRDHPIKPLVDEECGDEQEYRRHCAAHISEHVEAMLAPSM